MANPLAPLILLLSVALLVVSAVIIGTNYYLLFLDVRAYIRRRRGQDDPGPGSVIPVLGGLLGAIALWIMPVDGTRPWFWIPLVLDWGFAPLFVILPTLPFAYAIAEYRHWRVNRLGAPPRTQSRSDDEKGPPHERPAPSGKT